MQKFVCHLQTLFAILLCKEKINAKFYYKTRTLVMQKTIGLRLNIHIHRHHKFPEDPGFPRNGKF